MASFGKLIASRFRLIDSWASWQPSRWPAAACRLPASPVWTQVIALAFPCYLQRVSYGCRPVNSRIGCRLWNGYWLLRHWSSRFSPVPYLTFLLPNRDSLSPLWQFRLQPSPQWQWASEWEWVPALIAFERVKLYSTVYPVDKFHMRHGRSMHLV